MQGIYKITNLITNRCYIGKTNNSDRRWKDHQRLAMFDGHKEYDKALYQSMRKYGIENFVFEIIEELEDYSQSGEREKYWIAYYDSYNNGYNESLGGDGGSLPGHCQGEANGRARLTEADVIQIRTMYGQGCARSDCYELFKDKIELGGFVRVWTGETWQHIMPEVLTEENKQRNASLGRGKASKKQRLLNDDEVKDIRCRKQQGESNKMIYEDYKHKISFNTLQDVVYNKTYKDVK